MFLFVLFFVCLLLFTTTSTETEREREEGGGWGGGDAQTMTAKTPRASSLSIPPFFTLVRAQKTRPLVTVLKSFTAGGRQRDQNVSPGCRRSLTSSEATCQSFMPWDRRLFSFLFTETVTPSQQSSWDSVPVVVN